MRLRTLTVGKSRSLKKGRLETWIKAEAQATFNEGEDLTEGSLLDLLATVEEVLSKQEEEENARWNCNKPENK